MRPVPPFVQWRNSRFNSFQFLSSSHASSDGDIANISLESGSPSLMSDSMIEVCILQLLFNEDGYEDGWSGWPAVFSTFFSCSSTPKGNFVSSHATPTHQSAIRFFPPPRLFDNQPAFPEHRWSVLVWRHGVSSCNTFFFAFLAFSAACTENFDEFPRYSIICICCVFVFFQYIDFFQILRIIHSFGSAFIQPIVDPAENLRLTNNLRIPLQGGMTLQVFGLFLAHCSQEPGPHCSLSATRCCRMG